MIFDQIRDVTVTFRRLEDEPDEDGDDSQDQKPDVETLEDVVVKQEFVKNPISRTYLNFSECQMSMLVRLQNPEMVYVT